MNHIKYFLIIDVVWWTDQRTKVLNITCSVRLILMLLLKLDIAISYVYWKCVTSNTMTK